MIMQNTLEPYLNRLRQTLETIPRGEILADALIEKTTGVARKRLDGAIRSWLFRHRGICVKHRQEPINGYVLLTMQDQAKQPEKRIQSAGNMLHRGVLEGAHIDCSKLTEEQCRNFERTQSLVLRADQLATGWRAEVKFIIGKTPRIEKLPVLTYEIEKKHWPVK